MRNPRPCKSTDRDKFIDGKRVKGGEGAREWNGNKQQSASRWSCENSCNGKRRNVA